MANTKLTALTELTDAVADDLVYIVDDPSGSPAAKKITLANLKKGYNTLIIPAAAFAPDDTNPAEAGTDANGNDYYAFDGGATEEAITIKIPMPEDWDRSTVKAMFSASSASGSTSGDTYEIGIQAVALASGDALNTAYGTPQVISDTLLADNGTDEQISGATPALTIDGSPTLNERIKWKVYRNTDGTDDMAEDMHLFDVIIQYKSTVTPGAW